MFFVDNKRDGARLLSVALLVFVVASTQLDHGFGKVIAAVSMAIFLYWTFLYRRLGR